MILFSFIVKLVLIYRQDLSVNGMEDSTNDIANLLGMLDPWYERNTRSLLDLPVNVVCQVILSCPHKLIHMNREYSHIQIISKKNKHQ